ncbi:hypothetical protein ACFQ34_33300 [Pseudonocardia benzenivorans]|uniref:Uncharacterized protein n=2 Tax=Pseudonocardia TaxID=1847 RepID=F4CWF6_PSEUX|nr:hypothetical protein [Pseudonocardia dioxanivorans]AEA28648.1 hypothetical protein Psed_6560 [Pseudonocardia dioxanivorans CB1190]GJF05621.1 hypothetical protein PSD17_45720 [Pseudonocardia sp. D17]
MPIRSPRGRSAAYRALWQWPLRSPLRLAGTVVVVIALAALVSVAITATKPASAARPTAGQPSAGAPVGSGGAGASPTVLPPVTPLTPTTLPLDQAPPQALAAAASWAAAWVNHPSGTTSAQWLAGLRPYTTDEYLGVLGSVDPGNVPASRVTGPPTPVRVSPASVHVTVPTDALTLVLLVVNDGSSWRVSDSDKA